MRSSSPIPPIPSSYPDGYSLSHRPSDPSIRPISEISVRPRPPHRADLHALFDALDVVRPAVFFGSARPPGAPAAPPGGSKRTSCLGRARRPCRQAEPGRLVWVRTTRKRTSTVPVLLRPRAPTRLAAPPPPPRRLGGRQRRCRCRGDLVRRGVLAEDGGQFAPHVASFSRYGRQRPGGLRHVLNAVSRLSPHRTRLVQILVAISDAAIQVADTSPPLAAPPQDRGRSCGRWNRGHLAHIHVVVVRQTAAAALPWSTVLGGAFRSLFLASSRASFGL